MWDILGLIVGMVFAFLLLSLLATIVQEMIASILSMRGKFLLSAMVQLLELDWVDESELTDEQKGNIKALQAKRKEKKTEWVKNIQNTRVYQKYMQKSGFITRLPSYLSAEQVIAILQELMVESPENGGQTDQGDTGGQGGRIETDSAELSSRGAGRIARPNPDEIIPELTDVNERIPAAGLNQIKQVSAPKPKIVDSMKHTKLKSNLHKLYQLSRQQESTGQVAEVEKIARSMTMTSRSGSASFGERVEEFEEKVTEKFNHIKQEITTDFNDMMDRTSGWYKKRAQTVLFCIGLIIAGALDADTFSMYSALSNNPDARKEVLALADQFVNSGSSESFAPATQAGANAEDQLLELRKKANLLVAEEIEGLDSALGFGRTSFPEKVPAASPNGPTIQQVISFRGVKLIGWLVTALAISLGSTFWFDILKQLINIRNAGARPGGN